MLVPIAAALLGGYGLEDDGLVCERKIEGGFRVLERLLWIR